MRTPWGYSVDSLPSIVTAEQFHEYTDGAFSSTAERIEQALKAASDTVRAHCGWHVAPVLDCHYVGSADGRLVYLPCMALDSVDSVNVCGNPVAYQIGRMGGMIRLATCAPDDWECVDVEYSAGVETDDLTAIVCDMAANMLAAAPGVSREQAGQISISYNNTDSGVSGGTRLLGSDMVKLAKYKLARSW